VILALRQLHRQPSCGRLKAVPELLGSWNYPQRRGTQPHRVAYPVAADNVSRPLLSRLREVNQPVRSTRNRFSRPRHPCWATSERTSATQRHDHQPALTLRLSEAVAMAEPEKATLLAGSRHDWSMPLLLPVYTAATPWLNQYHSWVRA
jgi:hypothetical protein